MRRHKWDSAKTAAIAVPAFFLIAYAAGLTVPLPAFFLPERLYLALGREAGAAGLAAARGHSLEAFAALPDRLLTLPPPGSPESAYAKAALQLPEIPALETVLRDLEKGLPQLRRARIVMGTVPSPSEIDSARKAGGNSPLALETRVYSPFSPILGLSYRLNALESRCSFELLLDPEASSLESLEVSSVARGENGPERSLLYSARGTRPSADFVLALSASKGDKGLEGIEVSFLSEGIRKYIVYDLGIEAANEPRVLVIGEKEAKRSFLESLYSTERVGPEAAAKKNLGTYELIVIDGLPLARIGEALERKIAEAVERRTASLLLAADSPDFGKKGDAPLLERLLPVSLMPRTLKDLPDLALLILIDVSGSMFGDKLSLAKVTGLEQLKNLKPSDRIGMMLFSDERKWAYDFPINSSIAAAPLLDPIGAGGGTDLAAALSEGISRIALQTIEEKHIVIVSDGVTKPADFNLLADQARRAGVTISTMGIGEDLDRPLLERLAARAGGRFYRVSSADEIPGLLFEDRKSAARPPFVQSAISILDLAGGKVATIGGMAQYAPAEPATVLFANELGDPLFASREYGNRAVIVFASDLYGTYTRQFFENARAAGAVKDRLDELFTEKPLEVSVNQGARGATVLIRSAVLVSPTLLLENGQGLKTETAFKRAGSKLWSAEVSPPALGRFRAAVVDRGSAVSAFTLALNGGLAGVDARSALKLLENDRRSFKFVGSDSLWLLLFFVSSLGSTIVLRYKR